MATIKKAPKAQFGKLVREGVEKAAEKTAPKSFKLEGSMIKDAIKKKEREALKEKMRGWDKEMIGKKSMKNGGSLTGLNASNKRDKGIDPKGAYTKVQKKALAGARGKASLTKDKQLGATKMKMGGSLKPVDKTAKPGLAKLPTAVRNKMGYQKNGGATKAKCGTCMSKKKK